jgi:hypothetical protein
MRDSLAPFAHLMREANSDEGWELARQAWQNQGLFVVNIAAVEQRKGWVAARSARNLAEQLFGKRRHGGS